MCREQIPAGAGAAHAVRPQLPLCSTALLPAELLQQIQVSTAALATPQLPQEKSLPRGTLHFCTVSLVHPQK